MHLSLQHQVAATIMQVAIYHSGEGESHIFYHGITAEWTQDDGRSGY